MVVIYSVIRTESYFINIIRFDNVTSKWDKEQKNNNPCFAEHVMFPLVSILETASGKL